MLFHNLVARSFFIGLCLYINLPSSILSTAFSFYPVMLM